MMLTGLKLLQKSTKRSCEDLKPERGDLTLNDGHQSFHARDLPVSFEGSFGQAVLKSPWCLRNYIHNTPANMHEYLLTCR